MQLQRKNWWVNVNQIALKQIIDLFLNKFLLFSYNLNCYAKL